MELVAAYGWCSVGGAALCLYAARRLRRSAALAPPPPDAWTQAKEHADYPKDPIKSAGRKEGRARVLHQQMASRKRALDEQNERMQRSAGAPHDDENDVIINGVTHHTEVLYKLSTNTVRWSLAVDYKYNYLYIVAFDAAPVILNLNTNEHIPYVGKVKYARSVTVDQETHDLYICTRNGIYKYKPSSGGERLVGAAGVNVWHVYYDRVLYYTDTLAKVSTLINGHSAKLVNIQYKSNRLVVDNERAMFFSNGTGLYSRQMDINKDKDIFIRHQISTITQKRNYTQLYYEGNVNDLVVDRRGRVYFATDDGIYVITKYNFSYRKVVFIKEPKAIAFDKNDNMIYSDDNGVYRLKMKAKMNATNTKNIIKQQETKLDIMDKLAMHHRDHVKMQSNMENYYKIKIRKLSQKIDKLETDQMKVLDSVNNVCTLITDIGGKIIGNCKKVKEQVAQVQ